MSRRREHQGDSHNFGRRVTVRGRRVLKPRTVFWEWLVLAKDSPLRRLLDERGAQELGAGAFDFLPTLRFFDGRAGGFGEVERMQLEPLGTVSKRRKQQLASIIGRSLALWSWLGVADLHWENLVLGVDAKSNVVFGPLDIEMMLADLALPTETKLLPDADPEYAVVCQHAAGVRRVLPYLGKPVDAPTLLAVASAYRITLEFLERQAGAIAEVLGALPGLDEEPLRVLLRGTEEYVLASQGQPLWPPLLDAEQEQLARGDIPYFFRLYGRRGIHYYADETLQTLKRLPLRGDVPQLEPLLDVSRGLRSPSRQELREEGLFTVLGAFDHPSLSGKHHGDELEVAFRAQSLVVRLPDGEELRSARYLGDIVSSVYLPCRCGEVRSVFVPEVTVCKSAANDVRQRGRQRIVRR
jgi:hypothetical protein